LSSSVHNVHLEGSTRRRCSASSHGCAEAADGARTSTIGVDLFSLQQAVLRCVFGRSLARVSSAILRERSDQVVILHNGTLAPLTFWLWRFRAILRRNLGGDPVRCTHRNSLILVLKRSRGATSLRHLYSFLLVGDL
jgi:hypothetical protein